MMKTACRRAIRLVIPAFAAVGLGAPAEAAFLFKVQEVGPDVVVEGSGTLNTSALETRGSDFVFARLAPQFAFIRTGGSVEQFRGAVGPGSFGSGSAVAPTFFSGDAVELVGSVGLISVPFPYVQGSPLRNSSTYGSASFATLGLTPGTYLYSWGIGATADSLTVQIGPGVSVPEPASALLFGAGLLGMGFVRRRTG